MTKESYVKTVLQREIDKLQNQLDKVISSIKKCPVTELLELRKELQDKLNFYDDKTSPELMTWVEANLAREKDIHSKINNLKNGGNKKDWDKRFKLESNINELKYAIYRWF